MRTVSKSTQWLFTLVDYLLRYSSVPSRCNRDCIASDPRVEQKVTYPLSFFIRQEWQFWYFAMIFTLAVATVLQHLPLPFQ